MNILQIKDIEKINSSVLEDGFLTKCLSEKESIADPTRNILNSEKILEYQLKDCFIAFYTKFFPKETYTYSQFIKEAYPNNIDNSDTKEKGKFEGFQKNINDLEERYKNAVYTPPFVSFIINSLIPNGKCNKQTFRNYEYKFFDARSYSYIMRNSDCLPYFCKEMEFSPKKLKSFFGLFTYSLFTETENEPLIDQFVSQYYIDYYFSIYLFSETLSFLSNEIKQPSLTEYLLSEDDYGFNLERFLFLCSLLQNASGICTKHYLFQEIQKIFFGSERPKYQKLFTFSNRDFTECFKECAYELIFYNEFIYPYIQPLYFQKFKELLENNFSDLTDSKVSKQLSNIISANFNKAAYKKNMSVPIKNLTDCTKFFMHEPENKILNRIFHKFYSHTPFYPNPSYLNYVINSECPYNLLRANMALHIEPAFISMNAEYYSKNARFLI